MTTIGSAADCDLVLDGLAPRHAEIRRDEEDEYVLSRLVPEAVTFSTARAATGTSCGPGRGSSWVGGR